MDQTVFDVFPTAPYKFLRVNRGTVDGNVVTESYDAFGIFKYREGMTMSNNQESRQSETTLKIKPSESFLSEVLDPETNKPSLVGHGIQYDGQDYEIVGYTTGTNYETNILEHYRLTLQRTQFAEPEVE